jgi:hypothetical protein
MKFKNLGNLLLRVPWVSLVVNYHYALLTSCKLEPNKYILM